MLTLLRNRWFRWSLLFALLIALGGGIYRVQPPEPMCVIDSDVTPCHFLQGNRLVTLPHGRMQEMTKSVKDPSGREIPLKVARFFQPGFVQTWDIATGNEIACYGHDGQRFGATCFSADHRFFAADVVVPAESDDGRKGKLKSLLVVDLAADKSWEIVTNTTQSGSVFLSPSGKYLAQWDERDDYLRIYDAASGCWLATRRSANVIDFSDDTLVHWTTDGVARQHIEVWNIREGKVAHVLKYPTQYQWCHETQRLLIGRATPAENGEFVWEAWNLASGLTEGEFTTGYPQVSESGEQFVVDSKNNGANCVEIRELPSGKLIAKADGQAFNKVLSREGRFLAIAFSDPRGVQFLDAATGRTLWHDHGLETPIPLRFGIGSETLYTFQPEPRQIVAYDCETGDKRATLRLAPISDGVDIPHLRLTADRHWLLIQDAHQEQTVKASPIWNFVSKWLPWLKPSPEAKNDVTMILDSATCRERFRLMGWNVYKAQMSDDGAALVTMHLEDGDRILRCWDVDARKPLRWAVGVPAGLGAICALFTWWRRWRGGQRINSEPL